ncbi:fatty acid--CoA ligase [Thermoactinomyces sp. CICC 23799]|uniref:fatty acid--CoA ligase n=1 Tax=Thermoactinomyces sp. CICC 23799 TaxID=2767429 RepID=UPI0018DB6538|nr:fatty acid--CoA ligase [Thermoactinomyces sp. CICC 23799]MBH8601524.1 fatty acid--CoA ligase [Thermoactinomyces sp. CICC 23799]
MYPTIGKILEQTVQKYPEKEALFDAEKNRRWTYRMWDREVNRLARAFLAAGVKKGDRVSTYLYNSVELATAFFACAKIGAVFNPVNFRLTAEEVAYILHDAEPKIVLFEKELESHIAKIHGRFPRISFWMTDGDPPCYAESYQKRIRMAPDTRPEAEVSEEDLCGIMYTSGTTGRPKGVMHRHRDMIEQSLIILAMMRLTPKDRGLVTAPMFHCAELHCAFLPRVHIGAGQVIMRQFDPKRVLKLVQEEKVTVFFAAPTMWNMLLQEDLSRYRLSSLRLGFYGGAPMAPALILRCREKLGIGLVQAYGMTEMGPAVTFLLEVEQITKAGSAGKPCLNHEVRVVRVKEGVPSDPEDVLKPGETGEILVRGSCMMKGYYRKEEETGKALHQGWYHTGDLGYLDEDGYLWVADRLDDMIISGGENIYPREVEDVLYEHPGVLDVAVLGEPDETWGERVVAYVVKKDPGVTADELERFCWQSEKLARYKRPREYRFVKQLPRNASGKIQKFLLRNQHKNQA